MTWTLAASVSEQLEKYGAYVGIAAFFGLAALSLLYFSQARELKRLRDWAGRAPERAAELEARVVAQAQTRRVQPAPQPKPAASTPATQAAKVAAAAGASKPAVAKPDGEQADGATAEPAEVADGTAVAVPVAATAATTPGAPAAPPAAKPATPAPASATPAPPGAAAPAPTVPAPTAGAPPPSGPASDIQDTVDVPALEEEEDTGEEVAIDAPPPVVPRATPRPAGAAALRSSTASASPRRPAPPPRRPQPTRKAEVPAPRRNPLIPILGVLAVVAVGAFAATQIFGGEEPKKKPNQVAKPTATADGTTDPDPGSETGTLGRAETQVSVFNGTTVVGLASRTADKIKAAGFPAPLTGNNPDQQRSATLVLYASPEARNSAQEVAKLLRVSDPQKMDERTRAQAPPEADVVVIVGSDQQQT